MALLLLSALPACHGGEHEASPPPLQEIQGPAAFADESPDPRIVEVSLSAGSLDLPLLEGAPTSALAYNGTWPGPLLHARVGDRVIVHFRNDLSEPTTIHWHGLRIDSAMDGSPLLQGPVAPGGTFTYDFVVPDAGTFWYHPHVNTIEQIEEGLYGAIVVEEPEAPHFNAERLFVLDDLRLGADNQISAFAMSGHDAVHGRVGNTLLVNGSPDVLRTTAAHGAVERWRIVNAATARTLAFAVVGASFRVIGTDGGLLPEPYTVERLELAAGQRYELEVTHDGAAGTTAQLVAYVLALDAQDQVVEETVPLAELTVQGEAVAAMPKYPTVTLPSFSTAPTERTYRLSAYAEGSSVVFTINDHAHDLPVEHFPAGQPVQMTIVNEIGPEHPFHLHGQFFQVLARDGGNPVEPGLKDTVLLGAQETVTILTGLENPGRWMFHCHIPEHAENGMMAELIVDPAAVAPGQTEPAPPHSH